MSVRPRVRCRKAYKQQRWSCKVEVNGKQQCSFGIVKSDIGYTIDPYENIGCAKPISETITITLRKFEQEAINRVLTALDQALKTGELKWKPVATKRGKKVFVSLRSYGEFRERLMEELRSKLKERKGGSV